MPFNDTRLLPKFFFTLITSSALFIATALSASAPVAQPVDFTLPGLDGKDIKLSQFRGKWVVVNYWATWCPPCLKEIPELIDFHEAHKDKNAVVLGVDFEDISVDELREFTESYFMSYPIVIMKPQPKHALGAISGLPTTFLVSPEGELVAKQSGPVTKEMILEFIENHPAKQK